MPEHVQHLLGRFDERRHDAGCTGAELPHVVAQQRELDPMSMGSDQLGHVAARGGLKVGIELAGQHAKRDVRAGGDNRG